MRPWQGSSITIDRLQDWQDYRNHQKTKNGKPVLVTSHSLSLDSKGLSITWESWENLCYWQSLMAWTWRWYSGRGARDPPPWKHRIKIKSSLQTSHKITGEHDAHDVGIAFLARVGLVLLSVWRWVGVVVEGEGADAPVGWKFRGFRDGCLLWDRSNGGLHGVGVGGGLQNALRHRRPAAGGSAWHLENWRYSWVWVRVNGSVGCS